MAQNDKTVLLEKQVLSFLLKDESYIEEVFNSKGFPLSFFSDRNNNTIAKLIKENYDNYKTKLVQKEWMQILDDLFKSDKIGDPEYGTLLSLFEELTNSDDFELEASQFDRIVVDWANYEANPLVKEAISKHIKLLNDFKTFDARDAFITELDKIPVFGKKNYGVKTGDIVEDVDRQIEDLRRRRESPDIFKGIPTGMCGLDKLFNGFEKGTLTLIGGIVGSGKSTFMLNISRNVYETFEKNVLVVSLEMSTDQWERKYNYADLRLDSSAAQTGDKSKISDEDFNNSVVKKLQERKVSDHKGKYKIISIAAQQYTFPQIMAESLRQFGEDFVPDIIFIDQLSLINLGKYSSLRLVDGLGFLTKDIRAYSQIHQVPIVVAVQANRGSITRGKDGKRTIDINIENVEDSNKVGADADSFLAVQVPPEGFNLVIKIVKQREGPQGSVELKVNWDISLIYDVESESARIIEDIVKTKEEVEHRNNIKSIDLIGDDGLPLAGSEILENQLVAEVKEKSSDVSVDWLTGEEVDEVQKVKETRKKTDTVPHSDSDILGQMNDLSII